MKSIYSVLFCSALLMSASVCAEDAGSHEASPAINAEANAEIKKMFDERFESSVGKNPEEAEKNIQSTLEHIKKVVRLQEATGDFYSTLDGHFESLEKNLEISKKTLKDFGSDEVQFAQLKSRHYLASATMYLKIAKAKIKTNSYDARYDLDSFKKMQLLSGKGLASFNMDKKALENLISKAHMASTLGALNRAKESYAGNDQKNGDLYFKEFVKMVKEKNKQDFGLTDLQSAKFDELSNQK